MKRRQEPRKKLERPWLSAAIHYFLSPSQKLRSPKVALLSVRRVLTEEDLLKIIMSHPTPKSNTGSSSAGGSNKLTLRERLVPPMKSIGQGANALQYLSPSPAWSVDFSRDGHWLAVCYGAPDPCVRVWRKEETAKQQQQQQGSWILHSTLEGIHARTIRSVAFCPLSNPYVLAAASFDASVSIWEYSEKSNEWECTTQLEGHDHEIKDVTWNATGSLLATCGRDKT
jgi:WD40 repeat protein